MINTAELKNIPFVNTTWVVAHNSFANVAKGWKWNAQQTFDLETLYGMGVRGFMLDLHYHKNEISLCHDKPGKTEKPGYCYMTQAMRLSLEDPVKLSTMLNSIYGIITKNPDDIMMLFLESYVPTQEVANLFAQHNLTNFLLTKNPNDPSLTVGELLSTPLVVFSDYGKGNDTEPSSFVDGFFYTKNYKESKYDLSKYYRCEDRDQISRTLYDESDWHGQPVNLFLLNHFYWNSLVSIPGSDSFEAINSYERIKERSKICVKEHGLFTNFITVDYAEQGKYGGGFAFADEQNYQALSVFSSDNGICKAQMFSDSNSNNVCKTTYRPLSITLYDSSSESLFDYQNLSVIFGSSKICSPEDFPVSHNDVEICEINDQTLSIFSKDSDVCEISSPEFFDNNNVCALRNVFMNMMGTLESIE